jgi:imidazolonepropionase-like amidohydrolase
MRATTALAGAFLFTFAIGAASAEDNQVFTVMTSGTEIGALDVSRTETGYAIFYEFRNNGRGPTFNETVTLGEDGLPVAWTIEGATTFGNAVDEMFELSGGEARWRDSTGEGSASVDGPVFYAPQNSSPYTMAIMARALMAAEDMTLPALPGGDLRLTEMETLTVSNGEETREVTAWAMSGTSLNPSYFLMDGEAFFGSISPGFSVLAQGFEGEDERLRERAGDYGSSRFEDIQQRVANPHDGAVRVRNVRVFDPLTQSLGEPVSVVVEGQRIASVDPLDTPSAPGEMEIDGAGGSLIPGMFEMHAHTSETGSFLNIAAGVTSVRDMGNDNDVLDRMIDNIQSGRIAGPRVYRSAFIEGASPFSSNNGELVSTEEEAVEAVHRYADRGDFHQIKIYNSMNPAWIEAVIAAARERDMRVSGHVPAFTNADTMIAAGYDEITHINQLMLGWVLEEGEDTRTLLRLTALRRLEDLDLDSEKVQSTIDSMAEAGIAIDPTFAIHEALTMSRNGVLSESAVDYIDHMPVSSQRSARTAMSEIADENDDRAYRAAFDKITDTLALMRERGIFMVPGTDMGGSFVFHRELELYQRIGMTPAEILAWATHGMAEYLGDGDELGRVEPGYLADFFLVPGDPTEDFKAVKTISMVAADGRIYFPADIYPEFGIRPFVDAPAVTVIE